MNLMSAIRVKFYDSHKLTDRLMMRSQSLDASVLLFSIGGHHRHHRLARPARRLDEDPRRLALWRSLALEISR